MADRTIGDLTQAESIGGEDLFVLEQNGEANKLQGSQLMDYVTLSVISVTVETLPAGSQATSTYNKTTGELSLGIPQGEAAPTITNIAIRQSDYHMIVTLSDGTSYDAGYCRGAAGNGIASIALKSGTHAAGTTDTYEITFTDGTTFDFFVYNGANGAGAGDMTQAVYDPQGKAQDIFAYADAKGNKAVAFTVTLSASGWSEKTQMVSDERFLTNGYAYSVAPDSGSFSAYGNAVIYADNVTTAGQIQFHCSETPAVDLTVNVLRIEVSA